MKRWKTKLNAGMTYVELIVVLSIFSVLSSVAIYNYGSFQEKVDIRNLTSDVALKIFSAQKYALSGNQSTHIPVASWRPAYGVFFTTNINGAQGADNKNFFSFADLNNDSIFGDTTCSTTDLTGECLEIISISKNFIISKLEVLGTGCPGTVNNLTLIFKRPDSSAVIVSSPVSSCTISYAQLTLASPKAKTATIKIYPSGRIQIN